MAVTFVYDYFLTLPDEVRPFAVFDIYVSLKSPTQQVNYGWKGGKTWSEYSSSLTGCYRDLMAAFLVFYIFLIVSDRIHSSVPVNSWHCIRIDTSLSFPKRGFS